MRTNGRVVPLLPVIGVVALIAAVAVMGLLTTEFYPDRSGAGRSANPIVIVPTSTSAETSPPHGVPNAQAPTAIAPASPDQVVAQVRRAFPFLTDVDFRCDTRGCAVLATIPPPTDGDDAFLKARQDMLLGGLARAIAIEGYHAVGPVQMDEVDSNVFRIRAAAIARPAAAAGG